MQPIASSLLAGALVLAVQVATAQDQPPGGGRPPAPPPEAIAACSGKAVGDVVSFTGHRGETLTGTCQKAGDVLAARPDRMPPRQGVPREGKAPPSQ
jgi:hypothetical protein